MTLPRIISIPLLTVASLAVSFALLPLKPLSSITHTANAQVQSASH